MTHPDQLARAINRCKSLSGEALLNDSHCKVVMRARNDFAQLLMINQQNPQAFGAQLLVEQALLISEQQKRKAIVKNLRKLKRSGKVSIAAVNELQDKLGNANTIIDQQTQKVEQMLTAIRVLGV
ncbi:MAG: hypothetical protein CMF50_04160 [Legionellales bacterium]|nr:hypothetical protein [Legionellales bacterium]